ncbi:hypothetical protein ACFU6I_32990 [Streptomyces sp. NPDC057486]
MRPAGRRGGSFKTFLDSYRQMLKRRLAECDVRDGNGLPVHLTPHQ